MHPSSLIPHPSSPHLIDIPTAPSVSRCDPHQSTPNYRYGLTAYFIDTPFHACVSDAAKQHPNEKENLPMKFKHLITAASLALLPLTAGAATLIIPAAA